MSKKTFNEKVDRLRALLNAIERKEPDAIILEKYRGMFTKITYDRPNKKALAKLEKKIDEVLESDELTLESWEMSKALGIEKLHKEGLYYINEKNFNAYMRFVNEAQARGLGAMYSSRALVEAVYSAKSMKLTDAQIKENIRRWAKKFVKYDEEGKVIEVENPKKLEVTNVRILHIDRRPRKRKRKKNDIDDR